MYISLYQCIIRFVIYITEAAGNDGGVLTDADKLKQLELFNLATKRELGNKYSRISFPICIRIIHNENMV